MLGIIRLDQFWIILRFRLIHSAFILLQSLFILNYMSFNLERKWEFQWKLLETSFIQLETLKFTFFLLYDFCLFCYKLSKIFQKRWWFTLNFTCLRFFIFSIIAYCNSLSDTTSLSVGPKDGMETVSSSWHRRRKMVLNHL